MRRAFLAASFVGAVATVSGCTAILGSFDVDNALSNDGGPGTDALFAADGAFLDGGDAQVICTDTTQTACGASCVTLATDKNNCGKCGRACGGSDCTMGACAAVPLYAPPSGTVGPIAISDTEVFVATSENKLVSCPKTGCTVTPAQITSATTPITAVATVMNATVAYATTLAQRPAIYVCPASGCSVSPSLLATETQIGDPPTSLAVSGANLVFNSATAGLSWTACTGPGTCPMPTKLGQKSATAFDFDATNTVYFMDNGTKLSSCPLAANCAPASYPAMVGGGVTMMQAGATRVFWFETSGTAVTRLATCLLPGCMMTQLIGSPIDNAGNLLVDASGIYWTSGNGATAKIEHCDADACTGGVKDFATNLQSPSSLVADDSFVYWAAPGGVYRLAK